jgi:hypothetical protein
MRLNYCPDGHRYTIANTRIDAGITLVNDAMIYFNSSQAAFGA